MLIDPTIGNLRQEYKSDDPIRQGFFDSTFFKPNAPSTADVAKYTYNGKSMQGSSSQVGQFGEYLDSIGKGDLLQRQNNSFAQQPGIGILLGSTPGENPYALNNPSNPLNFLNVTPPEIPLSMQQPIPGLGAPPQGIGSLTPAPQQPMMPTMPGNTMPGNTMGGINSLSEFGKPPSLGGNNSFQPNQQPFKDNQGLNSYIDNMVNGRLKDIFGGIMGSFK